MYKKYNGFTILELLISISIFSILISIITINILNIYNKNNSQDKKKILELYEIDRVVNEYLLDTGQFPGEPNIVYTSSDINWIPIESVSTYISFLPADTINYYKYKHDGFSYELNAVLQKDIDSMKSDNGNNDELFEIGNNLNLLN